MKLLRDEERKRWLFMCPGCGCYMWFDDRRWQFNGDVDKPTVTPSILWQGGDAAKDPANGVCHLFIRDGKIEFLGDCTHEYAGKTVDMTEET